MCGRLAQAVVPSPLEGYESPHDFDELLAVLRDEFATWSAIERLLVRRAPANERPLLPPGGECGAYAAAIEIPDSAEDT
ncbi:MAG: hypothetical protein MUQ10_11265 [Anaerolineae bacterium]|nr:hypothetical protein [Anaerolineae bacterium]